MIIQPALCLATTSNAGFEGVNGRFTPYNYNEELRPPETTYVKLRDTEAKYRQLVGDLRYLADSTIPDISYATERLGAAMHSSTPPQRHCTGMTATVRYLSLTVNHGILYRSGLHRKTNYGRITNLLRCQLCQ